MPGGALTTSPVSLAMETKNSSYLDKELKGLIDENSDLWYHRVHELARPKLGKESYWEWITVHMRKYMLHIVLHDG